MDPISSIITLVTTAISRIWPDKTEAGRAQVELIKQQLEAELSRDLAANELLKGQLEVNKIEAASSNLYVSGWRPFIGWICGICFAYQYLIQPMIVFLCAASNNPIHDLPVFNYSGMTDVLLGLLGLGAMRTFEKVKGTTK